MPVSVRVHKIVDSSFEHIDRLSIDDLLWVPVPMINDTLTEVAYTNFFNEIYFCGVKAKITVFAVNFQHIYQSAESPVVQYNGPIGSSWSGGTFSATNNHAKKCECCC